MRKLKEFNFVLMATFLVVQVEANFFSNTSIMSFELSRCGRDCGCILFPEMCDVRGRPKCSHILTFKLDGDYFTFNIFGRTVGYIAIAFSVDSLMGNDESVICAYNGTQHRVFAKSAQTHPQKDIQLIDRTSREFQDLGGLVTYNEKGSVIRELHCQFTRYYKLTSNFGSKTISYDLANGTYYVFFATGEVISQFPYVQKNLLRPLKCKTKILFAENKLHYFEGLKRHFQTHALLASLGWLFFYGIGIFLARHARQQLQQHIFGKALWFWCHIICMTSSFALCLTCIIHQIVINNGTWSKTDDIQKHGIFGVVATILSFINIVAGVFRPSFNTKNRTIFNYLHRCNGLLGLLFANVSMWLGSKKMNANLTVWFTIMIGIWTGYFLISFILFEHFQRKSKSEENVHGEKVPHVKSLLFFTFIIILSMLSFIYIALFFFY